MADSHVTQTHEENTIPKPPKHLRHLLASHGCRVLCGQRRVRSGSGHSGRNLHPSSVHYLGSRTEGSRTKIWSRERERNEDRDTPPMERITVRQMQRLRAGSHHVLVWKCNSLFWRLFAMFAHNSLLGPIFPLILSLDTGFLSIFFFINLLNTYGLCTKWPVIHDDHNRSKCTYKCILAKTRSVNQCVRFEVTTRRFEYCVEAQLPLNQRYVYTSIAACTYKSLPV